MAPSLHPPPLAHASGDDAARGALSPILVVAARPSPPAARSSNLPAQWRTRPPSAPHPTHATAGAGAGADTAGGTTSAAGSGTLAAAGQPLAVSPPTLLPV